MEIKTKKKLVIKSEYLPDFLDKLLNGGKYKYGKDDDLDSITKNFKCFPVICYEIFYSFFISKHLNSSNIIFLLSSEEFFKGSVFGQQQYNNIIKLRAIENRVPVVKASNHGYAIAINSLGNIQSKGNIEFSKYTIYRKPSNGTFYNKINEAVFFIFFLMLLIGDRIIYQFFKIQTL